MICCAFWETLTAKVGGEPFESIVGKYGLREKNDRGESLIEFSTEQLNNC